MLCIVCLVVEWASASHCDRHGSRVPEPTPPTTSPPSPKPHTQNISEEILFFIKMLKDAVHQAVAGKCQLFRRRYLPVNSGAINTTISQNYAFYIASKLKTTTDFLIVYYIRNILYLFFRLKFYPFLESAKSHHVEISTFVSLGVYS